MLLATHHPNITTIFTFKGMLNHMDVGDQQCFFHNCKVLAWLGGPKIGKENLAQIPFCKLYNVHKVDT
jgi:hypothetical protein